MREAAVPVKLWDLPVRLIHWGFVLLLPLLWWSAESGQLGLHKTFGLVMLTLVVTRLLWGLVGSSTARFAGFVRGPRAILDYLKGRGETARAPVVGHNPLGGWSVMAMLALLGAQVALGLVTQDVDGLESGPLNQLVSWDTAEAAREAHELLFNLILALVVLHIGAIAFYRFVRKDDLVRPMVTGRRRFSEAVTPPRIAPLWRAALCAVLAAALAAWVWLGAPPFGARYPWDQPALAPLDAADYM